MIAHIVLLRPRSGLSADERRGLLDALRHAFEHIPEVSRVRIGKRRVLGRAYDALGGQHFEYAAIVEFETERALRAYLDHPAHEELGRRFHDAFEAALVHDFEMAPLEEVDRLAIPFPSSS